MIEKLKYLVTEICKKNNDIASIEILENSELDTSYYTTVNASPSSAIKCRLKFKVNPTFYLKNEDQLNRISGVLLYLFQKVEDKDETNITDVEIKPDYDKITVLNSQISIVETKWSELNNLQKNLIENMKIASNSIDFQNIGNSARTIMNKLAITIFDKEIHIAPDNIKVSSGNFKNQLHTYIKHNLGGSSNKELRKFSIASIEFAEKSIDLMNVTTHKLDAQKHFAEICVISTISVIGLIKAVNDL
ncbi:hypothetical protein [Christiangramia echinicola]|uniref:hypothetical protein n=1 Tax=Christiangramia echinicola TaxID=279359 RepID=UPI00041847C1|nr:hypothetical protein [Christiangramia echinicola]